MWILHRFNMMGLMPKAMIDHDPLFTSAFVANLGSVGLEAGYHQPSKSPPDRCLMPFRNPVNSVG
jgi:hypothetical protein